MFLLIIIGIIAYAAGDQYFELFKCVVAASALIVIIKRIAKSAPERRARREERRTNRAIAKAQKELRRSIVEVRAAAQEAVSAVTNCQTVEISCKSNKSAPVTKPKAAEVEDPYDINVKELTIEQLQKRLNVLYNRMDKLKYQHGTTPEAWEKYKKTSTYRGVDWDITDTEERLARAIENEKRKWASV